MSFLLDGIKTTDRVLDVGCASGVLMNVLQTLGVNQAIGVDVDTNAIDACRESGFEVKYGCAESLPFEDESFDFVISSVVLPYTDERRAVLEFSRVLRPTGTLSMTCHGIGYGINATLGKGSLKKRFYGLRMLGNTFCYRVSNRRLPGFLGDTLCQSGYRLKKYYAQAGLSLESECTLHSAVGQPIFIGHRAIKRDGFNTPSVNSSNGQATVRS